MQATKQQGAKKGTSTTTSATTTTTITVVSNATARSNQAPPNSNNNLNQQTDICNSKSVAQRVMDVTIVDTIKQSTSTISHSSGVPRSPTNGPACVGSNQTQTTKSAIKSTSSSSNSVENDQEVEDITNRVATKLDLQPKSIVQSGLPITNLSLNNAPVSGSINSKSSQNEPVSDKNNNTARQSIQAPGATSKTNIANLTPMDNASLLASPTGKNNRNSATSNTNTGTLISHNATSGLIGCESAFRQAMRNSNVRNSNETIEEERTGLESTNQQFATKFQIVSDNMESNISLDTKVPHPLENDLRSTTVEENNYYNDSAARFLLRPRAGGSLDNDTRPKLIAASKEQKFGSFCMPKPAVQTVSSHSQPPMQQQQPQQQPPATTATNNHHTNQQLQPQQSQPCRHPSSREYHNDLDEVYDECEARYDNAMMVGSRIQQRQYNENGLSSLSIPSSPKAKSAPTTPCNITPTAFHQHQSHLNNNRNQNPANTLPLDIRKNISATCRVLPTSMGCHTNGSVSPTYLDELFGLGELAFESEDYFGAIDSLSRCIELATNNQNISYLKKNFKVYSQRAEAHFKLHNYSEAIRDAVAARELNPKWTQAYYLQGRSQFLVGEHADSLAVFAYGLAQDVSCKQLFKALVEAALESNFKHGFEPQYQKLRALELDSKPFIVVSVLGQELLSNGHGEHAAIILESALKMGPDDQKFKGSVLSTIARAYCMMKDYDKAIAFMQKELEIESELEDVKGQCRVLSNLGYTYYKVRKFDKSLEAHRKQLNLAMKTHLFQQASVALNAIGHVHSARSDHSSALTSHSRCLDILKQLGDNDFEQFREILCIGHTHSMLNDCKAAEEKYNEAFQLLNSKFKDNPEDYQTGLIMVKFNLAYLALKRQAFTHSQQHYDEVIKLAQTIQNPKGALYKMRALNGLGHAHRLFKKFDEARGLFERQLKLAEKLGDQIGQSQALCNLGMTYQHFRDYDSARRCFEANLKLVDDDGLLKAYAHSYMGSIYFLMGRYPESHSHYECSHNLFKELEYCSSERKTIDLNMAFVQERAGHSNINVPANPPAHHKKLMVAS